MGRARGLQPSNYFSTPDCIIQHQANGTFLSHDQLPEYEWQNATVLIVFDLDRRIDTQCQRRLPWRSTLFVYKKRNMLSGMHVAVFQTGNIKRLRAIQAEGCGRFPLLELQGQHTHPNQVRAMYTFERFRDDGPNAH